MSLIGSNICEHFAEAGDVTPAAAGCVACLAEGQTWHHLRLCLTCGYVGCCNASAGRHATRHFEESGHATIKSFEPREDWGWCFLDSLYIQQVGVGVGKYWDNVSE